jgi:antitoxin component YwqK of YwqJK toxin-antitoxin module
VLSKTHLRQAQKRWRRCSQIELKNGMKIRIYFLLLVIYTTSCESGEVIRMEINAVTRMPRKKFYFKNSEEATLDFSDTSIGKLISITKPLSFRQQEFYDNGKLSTEGMYLYGRASGLWKFYYENGGLKAKAYYSKGYAVDSVFCYYQNGFIQRLVVEIDKAKRYWHSIDYFENGRKWIESYKYTDSLGYTFFDGPFKEWYSNGILKQEATMKMGNSIGKWRRWDANGKVMTTSTRSFTLELE